AREGTCVAEGAPGGGVRWGASSDASSSRQPAAPVRRCRASGPGGRTLMAVTVRAFDPAADRSWATELLDGDLAGAVQARRGETLNALDLPGLVADDGGRRVGLLFYRFDGEDCELFLLLAATPAEGIGTALVEALVARAAGRRRIWVVTNNDNLRALRLYQRRG